METAAATQSPGWLLGDEEGLVRCLVFLVKHCLDRGWNFCSEYRVSRLHQDVWPRVPARDHVGTLREPKARGWWKELQPRGTAPLIPLIPTQRGVLDLFPPVQDGAEPGAHRETLSSDHCVSWCECVALIRHVVKLQEACDAKANHMGRGVMNAMDERDEEKRAAKAQKYRSHLAWMTWRGATRSRMSKRTTWPTSSCRRAG